MQIVTEQQIADVLDLEIAFLLCRMYLPAWNLRLELPGSENLWDTKMHCMALSPGLIRPRVR